jgi:outer membrane protein
MRTAVRTLAGLTFVLACAAHAGAQPPLMKRTAGVSAAPGGAAPAQAFPDGAKLGFVDLPRVAAASSEGKAMVARIEQFRIRKTSEVSERREQVEALQAKLALNQSVIDDQGRVKLQRAFERARIDFQRFAEQAQLDVRDLQQELQREFTSRLFPIIGEVAEEKNLWAVFSTETVLWNAPALDLSDEVARRLDASAAKDR